MTVLHVIQNLNYGGMERVLADLARGTDRKRFDVHVLALQYLGRYAEELRGCATLHVAPEQSRWSMLRPRVLTSVIRGIAPAVVHTHSGVWYKASLAARSAGVPRVIHTEHGRPVPDGFDDRLCDRLASNRTDVVVAVSDQLEEILVRSIRVPRRKVCVVPNGIDTSVYRSRPDDGGLRRMLGIGSAEVIGTIGRLEPVKRYDVMLRAFAVFCGLGGPAGRAHLLIVGDGSERLRLERMADSLGVAERVHFMGWRDDIHELHALFDVFTLSSSSEGTSISLLEAMSAEVCPVVTDVGGNAAVLGDELRHRLVPSGDVDALAAAWQDCLADRESAATDARNARARVVSRFNLGVMLRTYARLYAQPEETISGTIPPRTTGNAVVERSGETH
jgi:glycosyltransferase involved in cell wall biosynthesis